MRVSESIRSFAPPAPAGKPIGQRLLVFPHAVGCASFFGPWQSSLPTVSVHSVQYPGREERSGERPVRSLAALASAVAQEILVGGLDYDVFFGHSAGAYVAFETAHRLQLAGHRPPALVVSSAAAPQLRPTVPYERAAEVMAYLDQYEPLSPDILREPELLDIILRYATADLAAVAGYREYQGKKIRSRVVGIVGTGDVPAIRGGLAGWAEHTEADFREMRVPGGHFYLRNDPPFALLQSLLTPCDRAGLGLSA